MASPYTICPLPAEKIDQAYAVVRLARPDLTLEGWRQDCSRLLADPSVSDVAANLAALDTNGFVRGLCLVRISGAGSDGALEARCFVTAATLGAGIIVGAMLESLVQLALQRHCGRLVIHVPAGNSATMRALIRARNTAFAEGLPVELRMEPAAGG